MRHKKELFCIYEKTQEMAQTPLHSGHAAAPHVAETCHLFSVLVGNDWLWSNQTACHWDVRVGEWGNAQRPASPAARINLFYQIMPAEINPERPSDMQIRQLYAKDGAAVSKVVKNSGMCSWTGHGCPYISSSPICVSGDQMLILC